MRRRDFIGLTGGAVVGGPLVAWALQKTDRPVVGFMHSLSFEATVHVVAAFRDGLARAGFVEGKNVAIEYRWVSGDFNRLPEFAAECVARRISAIVATGSTVSARAAKAATSTIPIVFTSGDDSIKVGLVEHLNRPGGNITGVTAFATATAAERLELLRELLPDLKTVAILRNPKSIVDTGEMKELSLAGARLATNRDRRSQQ